MFLSSILDRRGYHYREAVKRVNDLLYIACVAENFTYMDQCDITLNHISSDGIHPNPSGTAILKYNILSAFSSFDSNLMDFKDDYDADEDVDVDDDVDFNVDHNVDDDLDGH